MTLATAPRDIEQPPPQDTCAEAGGHDWRQVSCGGFDECKCRRCGRWSYELSDADSDSIDQ